MPRKKQMKEELLDNVEKRIIDLSVQELRELLLINTYKLAVVRSQLEAVTSILIKKNITTYEEIWKKTNDTLKKTNI